MSDDINLPTMAPEDPDVPAPTDNRSKKGWLVVGAVVVAGALLVGGAFWYRAQQVDDRNDARAARTAAAQRVLDAQHQLDTAKKSYDAAQVNLRVARASAGLQIPAANDLAAKADAADQLLHDHATTLHSMTQAWLDRDVSEYNRLVGELNARLQALRDAGDALSEAEQQFDSAAGNSTSTD
jgi:hypothetical protein